MSERWQREVRKLRDVEPGPTVWDDARTRQPGGDGGLPPTRQRIVAGAVAFAVFIGAGLFAWQAFRPSGEPNPVGPIDMEHVLVVSFAAPGTGQEVPNPFTENEPRPRMTVTYDGVALDGMPVSYTWCQEPGVDCSSVTADYDITFFQPVPAGTDVIVEGDANDVSGSFHLWRGEGLSLSMADDVPATPGSYELLVDASFDRGEVTFSVGIKVIDAQPASPSGSPSTSASELEPLRIAVGRPQSGSQVNFRATYGGEAIPLDSIETPGSDLEYPTVLSVSMPVGTPIIVESEADTVSVFQLEHSRGEFVLHGSCIVPGALAALPGPGLGAFFIYVEWPDAAGGMAFRADMTGGTLSHASALDETSDVDANDLGLSVCAD